MFKKNLKKLVAATLTIATVASTMIMASAADQTVSKWIESPAAVAGKESERTWSYRVYEAAETASAEAAYAQFSPSSFGSLQSNFVSAGMTSSAYDRKVTVYLKDLDDPDNGNPDDLIRSYTGVFYGRKLMSIAQPKAYAKGDIEGKGDNAAELYITMKVDRLPGDPTTPAIASGLFDFRVGMD